MVTQIKQSFKIVKFANDYFEAQISCENCKCLCGCIEKIIEGKTYQETRLAAIQYLKDHQ